MVFGVTHYTNQISDLESAAASGLISEAQKLTSIEGVLSGIQGSQSTGLLLCMVVIPYVLMLTSYLLYRKHYILDEEEYDRICRCLAQRKETV
jgi:Na+/melibiose symporter-like transporter